MTSLPNMDITCILKAIHRVESQLNVIMVLMIVTIASFCLKQTKVVLNAPKLAPAMRALTDCLKAHQVIMVLEINKPF